MDAARTINDEQMQQQYIGRSENEMPASKEEIEETKADNVKINRIFNKYSRI